MYFTWKEEYSVNIKDIDDQHKELFEIGSKISNIVFSKDVSFTNEEVISFFYELKNYSKYHFDFEENYMKEIGYVHFETHKNEHDILIKRIEKLEENFNGKIHKETLMELFNVIFEWISTHILKGDKKFMVV